MKSLSIGQNQVMEHIQTTELEEHEMNLQGFVWTNMFEYFIEKLARWDTEVKSPNLTIVNGSGKRTTVNDSDLFVLCAQFWRLILDSGDFAVEIADNAAQKRGAHFEKCTLLELWCEHGEVWGRMWLLIHFGGEWVFLEKMW